MILFISLPLGGLSDPSFCFVFRLFPRGGGGFGLPSAGFNYLRLHKMEGGRWEKGLR